MAANDIIGFYEADGTTLIPTAERSGVVEPFIEDKLVFSDQGGSGVTEIVIRNISSNKKVLDLDLTTSFPPTDPEDGGELLTEWRYKEVEGENWSDYQDSIRIPEIPPGRLTRVEIRVNAGADSNPTTHRGTFHYEYLASSV